MRHCKLILISITCCSLPFSFSQFQFTYVALALTLGAVYALQLLQHIYSKISIDAQIQRHIQALVTLVFYQVQT